MHAYDDELAGYDALGLAALIRAGELSRRESLEAALRRAALVDPELNAVQLLDEARAFQAVTRPVAGPFSGVPTFIKDNTDVAGWPTGHGSEAFEAGPARRDAPMTGTFRDLGLVALGKTRLPEFGFNATTEFRTREPVRNPWNGEHSAGGSSGGSAALVAAGVVPIAHANDGGGSIRIPAAVCGLVGLKPTRGRFPLSPMERVLPVNIVGEGVLTRTVRDTAHFFAHAERRKRSPNLAPLGLVEGPGTRRLRIGLVLDSPTGVRTDPETRAAVETTAKLLVDLGHDVSPVDGPGDQQFAEDFQLYWGFLGFLIYRFGPRLFHGMDRDRLDGLTIGLSGYYGSRRRGTAGAITRLRRSRIAYERGLAGVDAILSPVLGRTTPRIGELSPQQPFDELFPRLVEYVGFTPLNNASGSPAISLPLGATGDGLPIGVQLMARHGQERVLLELAYELEAVKAFRRLDSSATTKK